MNAEDFTLELGEMHFAAKRWGNPQGLPVLALHGWLDNCASFDFLGPLLPQLNLICLDLAGHGKSDHRSHFGAYNIWQDVNDVFAVADALDWPQFSLIGHSRGAIVALLAAGTFPQRIHHLALIEGIYPPAGQAHTAPAQLAEAITSLNQLATKAQTCYPSFNAAATARANGLFKVPFKDAQALAQQGVEAFEGGYTWAHDYKVMAPAEVRLTQEQLDAFLNAVDCPIHVAIAQNGLLQQHPDQLQSLLAHPNLRPAYFEGQHHLHMSPQAPAIAAWLQGVLVAKAPSVK